MTFELSLPIKILALVALVLAGAGAGACSCSTGASSTPSRAAVRQTHRACSGHPPAAARSRTHVPPASARRPRPARAARNAPCAQQARRRRRLRDGRPGRRGGARAGARGRGAAHARLVVLDVGNDDASPAQTATWMKNDVVEPAVLVVERPGTIVVELDGYADSTMVAQAVARLAALSAELVREATRDGRRVAMLRCYDDPRKARRSSRRRSFRGGHRAGPPRPYRFATAPEAFRFVQEALLALQYLGCNVALAGSLRRADDAGELLDRGEPRRDLGEPVVPHRPHPAA